jgi:serine/threonine protein kinase
MAVRIESHAEPIPGYRLIERLGGGGFGEVWKAEAPGGLFKAIKFVFGDLQGAEEDGVRAVQELKALSRVKGVHHPYILSLERYDIIDGQLIIVMELAHRTLWDRYRECRAEGLPGVPRDEILRYLEETAEALDMMNQEHHLQHLDIKPQNLFLVHNHVKVADFGLVKDLEGVMASVTGGVTPVYAAPETFDGWVSRFSDQYSLAIVFQEMLTGQRPFAGTTVRQLVLQHLQAQPDLSALPPHDRPAVARALAKNPDDRYPTCLEFAKDLRRAVAPAPPAEVSPEAAVQDAAAEPEVERYTRHSVVGPAAGAEMPGGAQPRSSRDTPVDARRDTPLPAGRRAPRSSPPDLSPAPDEVGPSTTSHRNDRQAASGPEVLVPALIIGIGGLAQVVLKQLRQEINEHFGTSQSAPQIRFLCLDTDPQAVEAAGKGGEVALRHGEVLVTRLQRPSYYLRTQMTPTGLEGWLPPRVLYRIPRQPSAAGVRALGRLAFVSNYPTIARRLEAEVKACCDVRAWRQATQRTGLGVVGTPRVYVVAGLAGGTGSGMFLDVAYVVKQLLKGLGYERPDVVGLLLLPEPRPPAGRPPALANAYAALTELHHFADPRARFAARYSTGEPQGTFAPFAAAGPPFQRCVLLPLGVEVDGWLAEGPAPDQATAPASITQAGHLLFAELCTPLGRAADKQRAQRAGQNGSHAEMLTYQTFGAHRVISPRHQLLAHAARRVCRRLIQRWMTKDARPLREGIKKWVAERWGELRLGTEDLITRLQEACERKLRVAPEAKLAEAVAPVLALMAPPRGKADKNGASVSTEDPRLLTAVVEALSQVERLVGVPEECQPLATHTDDGQPAATLVEALKSAAASLADESELKLAQMIVRLIEQPAFRLAGAEETIRQLSATVEQALRHQEQLAAELQERSVKLYSRLRELLDHRGAPASQPETSSWKMRLARKSASASPDTQAGELVELLRAYPKCRYQSLVLQKISAFYLSLRGQLSDQLVEVDFCRSRLGELAALMGEEGKGPAQAVLPLPEGAATYLLPEGCLDLEEAVRELDKSVADDELQALDQRVQELIARQFRALVQVCMTASNVLRALAPQMRQEAEAYLASKVAGASALDLYLAREAWDGEERFRDAIGDAFDRTAPGLTAPGEAAELCLLGLPAGPGEEHVRELAAQIVPERPLLPAGSNPDEIVFYREQHFKAPFDLRPFAGPALEAYRLMLAQETPPHSRMDIREW